MCNNGDVHEPYKATLSMRTDTSQAYRAATVHINMPRYPEPGGLPKTRRIGTGQHNVYGFSQTRASKNIQVEYKHVQFRCAYPLHAR
jgi:hypothetical protein